MTTAANDKTKSGGSSASKNNFQEKAAFRKRTTTDKKNLSAKKKTAGKKNASGEKKTAGRKNASGEKKTAGKKSASVKKGSSFTKNMQSKKSAPKKKRTVQMRKKQLRLRLTMAAAVPVLVLFAVFFRFSSLQNGKAVHLSDAVLQYKDEVKAACESFGISDFSEIALAVMQQESAGSVPDVMQSSESPFNTMYPNTPGAITDPSYSIQVGIETLAYCLEEAGCTSPSDSDRLKLALQTYNYGNSYATWALENYGEYSEENAAVFSENMKAKLGWSEYGDKQYVPHVLRYYRSGFSFLN